MDEVLSHALVFGDNDTHFTINDFPLELMSEKVEQGVPLMHRSAGKIQNNSPIIKERESMEPDKCQKIGKIKIQDLACQNS